jgi:hypothetical protein
MMKKYIIIAVVVVIVIITLSFYRMTGHCLSGYDIAGGCEKETSGITCFDDVLTKCRFGF